MRPLMGRSGGDFAAGEPLRQRACRLHEAAKEPASMSTLFAFLHHLAAFTLVSAIAVEFALIRQELTASTARKLLTADAVYGIAAGALLVIGRASSISRRVQLIIFRATPSWPSSQCSLWSVCFPRSRQSNLC